MEEQVQSGQPETEQGKYVYCIIKTDTPRDFGGGRHRRARRPRLHRPLQRIRRGRLELSADRLRSHARERACSRARERSRDEGLHRSADELRDGLPHRERHQGVPEGNVRRVERRAAEDGRQDRVRSQGQLGQGPGDQRDRAGERGDPPAEGRDSVEHVDLDLFLAHAARPRGRVGAAGESRHRTSARSTRRCATPRSPRARTSRSATR